MQELTIPEVVAVAAEAGVTLRPLCPSGVLLFSAEGTFLPVTLSWDLIGERWVVRRRVRRRSRKVFQGKLEGALKEIVTWHKTLP